MKLLGWQGAVDVHGCVSVGLRVYFSCSSVCGESEKRTLFKLPLHPADPYELAMLFPDIRFPSGQIYGPLRTTLGTVAILL